MKHHLFTGSLDKQNYELTFTRLSAGIDTTDKLENIGKALESVMKVQDENDHRPSGIAVATILKHQRVDSDTLTATLLSDPRLRDKLDNEDIEKEFGRSIANIVNHIHWLNTFKDCTREEPHAPEKAETMRRMLLATVDDIRAVLAKLAYRVQRLRGLSLEEPQVRRCIARETMEVYAPLANRLGIAQLKWEMEDLSFRYLEPENYQRLAQSMEGKRVAREAYIQSFTEELLKHIRKTGIDANIFGRAKHLYSTWKKMQHKHARLEDIADLLAVRVIVQSVPECYMVLGMVHNLWTHLAHEFDDYIANPKGNGYQSIHTAVIGPSGRVVEIQIRTGEMQEFAENGVAAHWRYKEGSQQDQATEQTILELREMLENLDSPDASWEDFLAELFSDRVYVMTPKGEVMELINGATPLDFAYAIHTDLGHRSRRARINGQIVPLTYKLQSGEKIEIITSEDSEPSRDWLDNRLGYLTTSKARTQVRRWFNKQTRTAHLGAGQKVLEAEAHRLGFTQINTQGLVEYLGLKDEEALLIGLGSTQITKVQLVKALNSPTISAGIHHGDTQSKGNILGVGHLATQLADCCRPIVGDGISGYIDDNNVVVIHRQDCSQVMQSPNDKPLKFIEVKWGTATGSSNVMINIDAFDRKRLLMDITAVLTEAGINMLEVNTRTDTHDQSVKMSLLVEVINTEQLSLVLDQINGLSNVFEARRSG